MYSSSNLYFTCFGQQLTSLLRFLDFSVFILGFTSGSDGKESARNAGNLGLIPGWEDPLVKGTATHFSILAWRIPWREELDGIVHGVAKGQTQLSHFHSHFQLLFSVGLALSHMCAQLS